jgi:hypothetical protein
MLAAYEGMRLGREAGLPSAILEQVVHEGGAQSRIADHWSQLSLRSATPVEGVGNFVFVSHTKKPIRAGGRYGGEQGRRNRG